MAKKKKQASPSATKYVVEADLELPKILHVKHPSLVYPKEYEMVKKMEDGQHIKFTTEVEKKMFFAISKAIHNEDKSRKYLIRKIDSKTQGIWRADKKKVPKGWGGHPRASYDSLKKPRKKKSDQA